MLDKDSLPVIGQKKAAFVPPHIFETPDGKAWAVPQTVTLGFVDADGTFVNVNQVMGTIVEEVVKKLAPVLQEIFAPIKPHGGS